MLYNPGVEFIHGTPTFKDEVEMPDPAESQSP